MHRKLKQFLIISTAAALSACSGGPSEGDIKALMEAEADQANNMVRSLAGSSASPSMQTTIHDVTVHECAEVRDDVYRCDVEVDVTAPLVGRTTQRSNLVVRETDAGWTYSR